MLFLELACALSDGLPGRKILEMSMLKISPHLKIRLPHLEGKGRRKLNRMRLSKGSCVKCWCSVSASGIGTTAPGVDAIDGNACRDEASEEAVEA